MSHILSANLASTTLASPIGSGATSLSIAAGTGAEFPTPSAGTYFLATLTQASNPLVKEIVYVLSVSGDTFTQIVRAQEGTTARSWSTGDLVQNLFTSGTMAAFGQVLNNAGNPNGYVAGSVGSAGGSAPTLVWDSINNILWVCTTSGGTSTAVWSVVNPSIPSACAQAGANGTGVTLTVSASVYCASAGYLKLWAYKNQGTIGALSSTTLYLDGSAVDGATTSGSVSNFYTTACSTGTHTAAYASTSPSGIQQTAQVMIEFIPLPL